MTFKSKYPNYRIVLEPAYYRFDNMGRRVFVAGKSCQFNEGYYTTDDEETIKALKKAKTFGIDFWVVGEDKQPNPEGLKQEEEMKKAAEETLTDCPICGQTFKNKAALMAHMRFKHKK